MMTPERLQLVKRIFHEALSLPADARSAWLDRECEGDMEIRVDVDSLLAAHEAASLPSPNGRNQLDREIIRDPALLEGHMLTVLRGALGRDFEIIRRIGGGGMGAVYLARDIALDLRVAIKVLRPELAESTASQQRFQREARIAARLKHSNIVQLRHYREVDRLCCFVMDHVSGDPLDDRLRIEGAMPCNEVRDIVATLAGALDYAHRQGVIHRDIKPANILFDSDDRPMLADFGIAKQLGAHTLTPTDAVIGTPAYMSPEQLQGCGDLDARSDLYSLGLVAYAMLVGREPYSGLSNEEIRQRKLHEEPVPLRAIAPSVPPGLADVIMRCLARDRELRFADAGALREALERADRVVAPVPLPWVIMPGFGQWSLVWATFWATYAALGDHRPREIALTLVVAGLVPLGFALQVWNLGRHGASRLDLARLTYWPPEWWGMWWPSILRRPADLWSRLPWQARGMRIVLSIFLVGMPALVIAQSMLQTPAPWIMAMENGLLLLALLATIAGVMWTRVRGIPAGEAARVLFGATMPTPAWRTERVAPLLAPARGVRLPQHGNPTDHCRAIHEIAGLLPQVHLELGREASAMAHRLLRVVVRHDREIDRLLRDASVTEEDRLGTRLMEMGAPAAGEPPSRQEFRDLLLRQLTVLRAMRQEADLLANERRAMFDLMRSLWAAVRRLHEDSSIDGCETSPAAMSLRGLCDAIDERLSAAAADPGTSGPAGIERDGGPVRPPVVAPNDVFQIQATYIQGSSPLGP